MIPELRRSTRILKILLLVPLLGAGGCLSTDSQILLLESMFAGDPEPRQRIPENLTWTNTRLPQAILTDAGVAIELWTEAEGSLIRKVKNPGQTSRKALRTLVERDLDPWQKGRLLATQSHLSLTARSRLTRAIALNGMVDRLRSSPSPPPEKAPKRSPSGSEVKSVLISLRGLVGEASGETAESGKKRNVLDLLPRPEGWSPESCQAALFLLSEIHRTHPDETTRDRAALHIDRFGHRATIASTVRALEDPEPVVREDAARGLGLLKTTWTRPLLQTQLRSDSSADVRRAAAWSLGELGDSQAVEPLIEALGRRDEVPSVLLTIRSALRSLTGEDAGDSREVWRAWWKAGRPESSAPSARPADSGKGGPSSPSDRSPRNGMDHP